MSHKESDNLELWSELRERNTVTVVFETFLFTLAMILSLFGNLMVCYAVRRNPGLCRRPSNYYIISLALTDISLALSTMPWSVILLATGKWPFGTFLTYFATISKLSLTNISVWTMVLMALNRVLQNCKANEIPMCFHKEVHCFLSLSGVGYIHCYLSPLYCHVSFFQPCVPGFCTAFDNL